MRPVRFNIHPKEAVTASAVSMVEAPDGYSGEGFFTARLSDVVGLARKNSIWPLPFATSCCGIEFMATAAAHYDLARFGAERMAFTPRQCDLLMVILMRLYYSGLNKSGLFDIVQLHFLDHVPMLLKKRSLHRHRFRLLIFCNKYPC